MSIGENIKKFRKSQSLTQPELANLINKSESTIQKYEANSVTPSIEILNKIAEALKIDLSLLLHDTNYRDLTNMNKDEAELFQVALAPNQDYKKYIQVFKNFGYKVITHIGKRSSGESNDNFIYDILFDDKLLITLDINGFCGLGNKLLEYKQTFDRSLALLVKDTINGYSLIYGISIVDEG